MTANTACSEDLCRPHCECSSQKDVSKISEVFFAASVVIYCIVVYQLIPKKCSQSSLCMVLYVLPFLQKNRASYRYRMLSHYSCCRSFTTTFECLPLPHSCYVFVTSTYYVQQSSSLPNSRRLLARLRTSCLEPSLYCPRSLLYNSMCKYAHSEYILYHSELQTVKTCEGPVNNLIKCK